MVADPQDIFAYMLACEIGIYLALFWEAYAVRSTSNTDDDADDTHASLIRHRRTQLVLEQRGRHEEAAAAFAEGLQRNAHPPKRLRKSHETFLARMEVRARARDRHAAPPRHRHALSLRSR